MFLFCLQHVIPVPARLWWSFAAGGMRGGATTVDRGCLCRYVPYICMYIGKYILGKLSTVSTYIASFIGL